MDRSRSGSIRRRLTLTVLTTTALAVALACAGFAAFQYRAAEASLLAEVASLSELVGFNAMLPLAAGDRSAVEAGLLSFVAMKHIEAAAVYASDGTLFARFVRDYEGDAGLPETAPAAGDTAAPNSIVHARKLEAGGELVGTIVLRASTAELRRQLFSILWIATIAFVLCLAPALLGARRVLRDLVTPLVALASDAERLAQGDWNARVRLVRDDEIGVLAAAFDAMAARLRQLMSDVASGSHQVLDATRTLRDASDRSHSQAEIQRTSVDQTAESVTFMVAALAAVGSATDRLAGATTITVGSANQVDAATQHVADGMDALFELIGDTTGTLQQSADSIQQIGSSSDDLEHLTAAANSSLAQLGRSVALVSDAASRSGDLSNQTAEEAKRGQDAVHETVVAIEAIDVRFGAIQAAIAELVARSQSIGDVVEVIDQVATETNLLSLNASIVGAQAGEYGRSFTVVAKQIGSLAERTARSSREIASLIRAVQKSMQLAVTATSEGSESVELGVKCSKDASGMLTRIIGTAEESAATVSGIAHASHEQSDAISSVEKAFCGVRDGLARIRESVAAQHSVAMTLHDSMKRTSEVAGQVQDAASAQTVAVVQITSAIQQIESITGELGAGAQDRAQNVREIIVALGRIREMAVKNANDVHAVQTVIETLSGRAGLLEASIRSLGFEA